MAEIEMPRYKCHKEVHALKIKDIITEDLPVGHKGLPKRYIVPEDDRYAPFLLPNGFMRHNPKPGGYFVVYKGGYKSFSPAEAFEDGYTLID